MNLKQVAAVYVGKLPFQLLEVSDLIKELNYRKILVCEWGSEIQESDFDEVFYVDLNDGSALDELGFKLLEKYNVDIVFGLSESNVLPAAYLTEGVSCKGVTMETAIICRNKFKMRQALSRHAVPMPNFVGINSYKELNELGLKQTDFPLISKPVLGFASQGVRRANNFSELADHVRLTKREITHVMGKYFKLDKSDSCPSMLIESYISGKEIAVDGIVINGTPHILLCIDKPDVSDGPYFGDSIHVAPAKLTNEELSMISATTSSAVSGAGIESGPFHIEIRLTQAKAYLIEIGARIGFPRLVRKSLGLDIVTLSQKVMLNMSVDLANQVKRYSGNLCVNANKEGVFNGITNKLEIESIDGVDEVIVFVKPGERVFPPPKGNMYIGFIIASGKTHEHVERALLQAKAKIELDISGSASR